ncbi:MAG TPA: Wzz/FepE/Etk N-terminal domain-containing protein [Tenuifilaceae bacterium]|nr:Wzz/FepE/Etk N-terminal domain-containing protein [Tenuifilaceae bacterium]HQB77801.1 Wzz/FepE/Etk N-terminal domain-containing protein [Tenuifilaceae bacterium]
MEQSNKEFSLNSTQIITFLWEKRKLIIIVTAIAFVVSMAVSFLIPERFKASAVVYPARANQQSKDVFSTTLQRGLTIFGEDDEAEQLLQILSSETLRDIVIRKHHLVENWGIDPSDRYARTKVYGIYGDIVSFRPTQYQSVRIDVEDFAPESSAAIANTIVSVADSLMRAAKAQVTTKALEALKVQYEEGLKEMSSLEDSLTAIMQNGVINFEGQTDRYHKAYAEALVNGNRSGADAIAKKIAEIAPYGSKYIRYNEEIEYMALHLSEMRENLKVLRLEASQVIPSQFVIDWASVPDKKTYPKKSIVIVVSTMSAFFFLVFLLIIAEFIRKSLRR